MSDTKSVLDQMTAGIMGRKELKATQLTPVGQEIPKREPSFADATGDQFEYERGMREQIIHSGAIIRKELATIELCLQSIERQAGVPLTEPPVTTITSAVNAAAEATKQAEKKADTETEKFQASFAAKAAAAQKAAFVGLDDPGEAPAPVVVAAAPADGGWQCPTHGTDALTNLESRKGRKYRACITCNQFEH